MAALYVWLTNRQGNIGDSGRTSVAPPYESDAVGHSDRPSLPDNYAECVAAWDGLHHLRVWPEVRDALAHIRYLHAQVTSRDRYEQ
jgi:hypothetical protein